MSLEKSREFSIRCNVEGMCTNYLTENFSSLTSIPILKTLKKRGILLCYYSLELTHY